MLQNYHKIYFKSQRQKNMLPLQRVRIEERAKKIAKEMSVKLLTVVLMLEDHVIHNLVNNKNCQVSAFV